MKDFDPKLTFNEANAAVYDGLAILGDEGETVELLVSLANGRPALELAVGTGRIALPLAERGVRVDGIDFSEPMIAKLHAKPGGDKLNVTIGDFADVGVTDNYGLVFIVFNSFFNVLRQDDQVRCFENVARHLNDDGVFLIEAYVPTSLGLDGDQYVHAEAIEVDTVRLDLLKHDGATQTIVENHVQLSTKGITFNPVVQRYAWPAELDLMARIAGLHLQNRWGGWKRQPFTSRSRRHVSVWGR
ncbi:MAG: class I SAM-dependent methyltransferase [Chloroflexota bacterium]|nr:class I SAM-dependent methyltransferase [Chloroflexota bacterium]